MSMKKKRKDQRGDTSISRTALGYATKASLMPSVTTSSIGFWVDSARKPSTLKTTKPA